MKTTSRAVIGLLLGAALATSLLIHAQRAAAADKLKALIIDGQNNHKWQITTPLLKAALESSDRFTVDVATSPASKQSMDDFKPEFSKYDVVIGNYNGEDWSPATKKAFEDYVSGGGGYVSVHAADNAFPHWVEYNKMIGVGGWNRNQNSGEMIRWRDGKAVREVGEPGPRGSHGAFFSWPVQTRAPEHPIMKGLPARWMHTPDELYSTLSRRERHHFGHRQFRHNPPG